jgi:phosphatidyl-myo-inositol dimannoside synthase
VLVISTQNFPPEVGGIGNLVYSLCSEFATAGEKIIVFADRQRSADDKNFDKTQKFEIRRYSGIKPVRRRRKAHDIHQFGQNNLPDSPKLITDSWKSLELVDRRPFSKILCLAHGTEIPLQTWSFKLKRIHKSFSRADYIIANSHYTAGLVKPYADSPDKLRVIYPGLMPPQRDQGLELVTQKKLGQYRPIIITVARLEIRKGQQQVIKILPELIKQFPSLLYVIVGEGPQRKNLEETAKALGVDRHVLFTGLLQGPQKNAYLANSDLFVMPGLIIGQDVEGFGMAYIEAGVFGLPSIACRAGGAPEAVIHDKTGLLGDPAAPEQLQDNIVSLLNNSSLHQRLGANARKRSLEFLWDKKIVEYKQLLLS